MSDAAARHDPRRHAWRHDLAAESLRGVVDVPRYVTGGRRQVMTNAVAVRKAPDSKRGLETELLFGEIVTVYETADNWSWVQAERDRYVGYVPSAVLSASLTTATHTVRAAGTFLYPEPDIKSPPTWHLSLNAPLAVVETRERFAALATGGFVVAHHIAAIDQPARDFVEMAERFDGTPYLWGGRTRLGVDCSGLVQLAMEAAGLVCPRDSDMQREEIGIALEIPGPLQSPKSDMADVDGLARGDLVFWSGHVGIMTDSHMLLHANGHHMATVVEPVIDAAVRISKQTGHAVSAIRRPPRLSARTV